MANTKLSVEFERLNDASANREMSSLIQLLIDAVDHGASVGFLRPLQTPLASEYWKEVLVSVAQGSRCLLVARVNGGIVGTVQLDLCMKPNGVHRAEVQKLLVLSAFRRKGIAAALMRAIEAEAGAARRSLLFLDTEAGSGAEHFYDAQQWKRVGSIPNFALSSDGVPTPNIIYCKQLK
jgi:acetyltransferase